MTPKFKKKIKNTNLLSTCKRLLGFTNGYFLYKLDHIVIFELLLIARNILGKRLKTSKKGIPNPKILVFLQAAMFRSSAPYQKGKKYFF